MESLKDHEAFEIKLLQWMHNKRILQKLVFGGGTMLRLCHELPRYPVDLDFWFIQLVNFENFYERMYSELQSDYNVTDFQNKRYSMLFEMSLGFRKRHLKIEIRKEIAPPNSTEEKIAFSPHSSLQVLVRGFSIQRMVLNKVEALLERGEIRDAFDLEFLLRRGAQLDLKQDQKSTLIDQLRGFKRRDFDVKLGSVLLPEIRGVLPGKSVFIPGGKAYFLKGMLKASIEEKVTPIVAGGFQRHLSGETSFG